MVIERKGLVSQSISVNVVKLLSTRIVGPVLWVITAPVLTRLFLPTHFGVMQIFDAIATVFFVIAGLNYEMSIPLAKNQQEASASFLLSLFFTLMFTVSSVIGVLLGADYIAYQFKTPELSSFLWLLPPLVFLSGLSSAFNYWTSHEGKFGIIAWSDLGNVIGDRVFTVLTGYLIRPSAIGLFVGRCVGVVVSMLVFLRFMGRKVLADIQHAHLTFATICTVGRQHKKFPLFSVWSSLLANISTQLLSIIFGLYFSPTVVGYYALANRVGTIPATLLGNAVAQVLFPTAAREYRETGTLAPIIMTTFLRFVQIGVFPMAILGLFGASLFRAVFGSRWIEAGIYAQIQAVSYFMGFLTCPLPVFTLTNRQDASLLMNVLSLAGQAASLFIGVAIGTPRVALGLCVFFNVMLLAGQLVWKLRLAQVSVLWAVSVILKYSALAGALLLPAKGLSWIFHDLRFDFGVIGFATVCYVMVLFLMEPSLRQLMIIMRDKLRNDSK
jgi:lipopolysaccharide exporter